MQHAADEQKEGNGNFKARARAQQLKAAMAAAKLAGGVFYTFEQHVGLTRIDFHRLLALLP